MKRVILLVILINTSAFGMLRGIHQFKKNMARVMHTHRIKNILPTLQKRNHRRHETQLFELQKKMLLTKLAFLQNKHISSPFWHGVAGFSCFTSATIIPYLDSIDPLFAYPTTFFGIWYCHKAWQNKDKIKEGNEEIDLVKKQLADFVEIERKREVL